MVSVILSRSGASWVGLGVVLGWVAGVVWASWEVLEGPEGVLGGLGGRAGPYKRSNPVVQGA